ncbi:hypothetical protein [Chryseobacterium sp. FH1]|uniref:hypothetical protein n=1 Tax=Chryseobacterium sp. FH1 TaxID=1233951 RepID=UPI000A80F351|nr:hypothetical protein [Chryseobacterium sp. FH1]
MRKLAAQDWIFYVPQDTKWLFISPMLDFESTKRQLEKTEKFAVNLWAQSVDP